MCTESRIGFATDLIFLPRPWLTVSEDRVDHDSQISRGEVEHFGQFVYRGSVGRVYARGNVKKATGEAIVLPYWHELAATLATPAATSITETVEP